ncbi:MAG TPA: family 20 glycosylhydrolase [Pyrinomonadaceae bacterium]|jgi:hexosaminidase
MKNLFFAFILSLVFCIMTFAQSAEFNIIPQPLKLTRLKGEFKFNFKTKIVATDDAGRKTAGILNDLLMKNYGFKLEYTDKPQKQNAIVFITALTTLAQNPNPESYSLQIEKKFIRIAGSETGQFYALQTLMQILPLDFKGKAAIPAVDIVDAPRFKYRGMHLDVGRHFFPVEFVKRYIDLMAQYKFNQFQWHLTDDQGWRIEIKKYPRLTEIGSRRKETQKEKNRNPYVGDAVPVEGFYTQEQIRDVVAYAKARKINVIPEIELPGHSSAALAAYPELGCKENYEYKVQTTWGIFKEVYCPSEATFKFLEDVLDETIALFPDSPYIHIGGDEVLKDQWKESAFVQELKAKENLKDEHEVQSYFIRRMEKFINSKGKKIIGWDEILEGGLAPNATVMSWRGEKGGIEAARAKHDVVMTPTDYLYFDFGQGDSKTEPLNIGNYLPLEKVYSYNPQPKELSDEEKARILGAQANLWTEYIKTPEKVEYMVFPRLLALSEVVWSPLESKNFINFSTRLASHFPRLDKQGVNYRIPEPFNLQNGFLNDGKTEDIARLLLVSPLPGSRIFYTLDGSEPTEKSNLRTEPFIDVTIKRGEKVDLKTIVVLPNGRKSMVYTATFLGREALPAVDVKDSEAGATFRTYAKNYTSVDEIKPEDAENSGLAKTLALMQFREKLSESATFAVEFEGYFNAPKDEIYEFNLDADDGAALWIDDEKVVNNDGIKEKSAAQSGMIPLKKGYHRFVLKYFKGAGKWSLGLRWGIKGQPLRFFSENQLFRAKVLKAP